MMQKKTSRRIHSLLFSLSLGLGALAPATEASAAPTGDEIMRQVVGALKVDGSEAVVEMVVGSEKRKLKMATKLVDGGKTEKRVYEFLEPADIRGTKVLVFDHESSADDVWVYLPALHKVRKVQSPDRAKSFLGSEFSYADLTVPDLKAYFYTLVKEDKVQGEDCYVVDVVPRDADVARSEGYSKKTLWVSKATFTIRQGVFFDGAGERVKKFSSADIKNVGSKHFRAMRTEMVNEKSGKSSVFLVLGFALNPNTKDEYFTTAYLERT
jgi:outer membrane lipoprotein-sorting protein